MSMHTRHDERDQMLPQARRDLVTAIHEICIKRTGVEGVFFGGSIARGDEDLYSDIDLRIVVSEMHFEEYVKDKQRIAAEFGEVLFYEDMDMYAPYTIAHYSDFLKVDLFIYTFPQLRPSLWLQGIQIRFDPTGRLQDILSQSNALTYTISTEAVLSWRGKVFAYLHEVYRRVMREEYYYALSMVHHLRSYIVWGWNMEAGRHGNDPWDWSKVEGARSQLTAWQLSLLNTWMCGRDQRDILRTLYSMVPELRRLHGALCKQSGLDEDRDLFDRIVGMVL